MNLRYKQVNIKFAQKNQNSNSKFCDKIYWSDETKINKFKMASNGFGGIIEKYKRKYFVLTAWW